MNNSLMIKVSSLLNNVSLLSRALNSGIKANITYQLVRTWQTAKELTAELGNPDKQEMIVPVQENFIEPEDIHAFFKLHSQIALVSNAVFLNSPPVVNSAMAYIKAYIKAIADYHGIDLSEIFN